MSNNPLCSGKLTSNNVKQCASFLKTLSVLIKEGVFFTGKSQRFFKNKGAFWLENGALRVSLNFDN